MEVFNSTLGQGQGVPRRSWTEQLADGVKDALRRGGETRVAVHSEAQAELGKSAAGRLAKNLGGDASKITFEVIPPDEKDIYPVGAILV